MTTLLAIGAFAGVLLLLLAVRPFTALTHELGHALAALLLTHGPVTIHVGGYGDAQPQLRLPLGRLTLKLNLHPLRLLVGGGLCRYEPGGLLWWQQALILLAGPLTSLLVAVVTCYVAFHYELLGVAKVFAVWATLLAGLYFVFSLIPSPHPVMLADGRRTYNDGWLLRQQWRLRRLNALWHTPTQVFQAGRFAEAAPQFERLAAYLFPFPDAHRMALGAYVALGEHDKAAALLAGFDQHHARSGMEYAYDGLLTCYQHRYEEGVALLDQALGLEPTLAWARLNRGYALDLLGRSAEAVADFDRVLAETPEQAAYALACRGLAYLHLGDETRTLLDLRRSLELDAQQPYAHRNWGIYYLQRGDAATALGYFSTAQALDARTHLLDDYLTQTRQALGA